MTQPTPPKKPPRVVKPFVKPGKPLEFVAKLEEAKQWPLPRGRISRSGNTPTPYLILQAFEGDAGERPLPLAGRDHLSEFFRGGALQFPSIRISPTVQTAPTRNADYKLACVVLNDGAVAAYGAVAEFYVAPHWVFGAAARGETGLAPLARASFVAYPGESVTVECPKPWKVGVATAGVLVQVYDLLLDPLLAPFDWRSDRHVARLDFYSDVVGTWKP